MGKYFLVRELGRGGMGVVHEARTLAGVSVVIKFLHADRAHEPHYRRRFAREIELTRRINSPFIPRVLDADAEAERPWMVTEYFSASSLTEVARRKPLTGESLLKVALGTAGALQDIHQVGLVHRDLKPENVLLTDNGPRVIDFGISWTPELSRLTRTEDFIGTPAYLAPEQIPPRGTTRVPEATFAVDIFAWASIVVFAATGRAPFEMTGAHISVVLMTIQECAPDLSEVPEPLRNIVAQCLVADPAARPTADSLVAQLSELVDLAGSAPPAVTPPREEPPRPSRHGLVRLARAGAAVMAVVATFSSWQPSGDTEWTRRLRPPSAGAGAASCAPAKDALFCAVPGRQVMRVAPDSGHAVWYDRSVTAQRSLTIEVSTAVVVETGIPQQESALLGFDKGSGKQLWKKPLYGTHTLAGQVVVTTDQNGVTRGFRALDGKELWTRKKTTPNGIEIIGSTSSAFYSREVTDSGVTFTAQNAGTGDVLWQRHSDSKPNAVPIGVTPKGTLNFTVQDTNSGDTVAVAQFRHDTGWTTARLREPVAGASITASGDTFYVATPSGSLLAVNCPTGEQRWRTEHEEYFSSGLTVADGRLYLLDDEGRLLVFAAASGARLWTSSDHPSASAVQDVSLPSPMVADGRAYAITGDDQLFSVGLPR
ncbi:protein kinase domain-containing protein [Streptomyces griseoruber]|uniref:Protein kinase domain-containing protein n=4 Tax=Streptomyces griseoruber TaxID=1943 RepID=A0A101SLK2_9ACTN|nr:serine/threonine-protein kinase [Streptomyces griseoruber]KUN76255.1 hypothetical protein AQJ64_38660 [Streptomyces griseoruber]